MKALLIDPNNRTVTEFEYDGDYRKISEAIGDGCRFFTTVNFPDGKNTIFVDDEGLISGEPKQFFQVPWYPTPLAGRGVVLGHDGQGESIATTVQADILESAIRWVDPLEVYIRATRGEYDQARGA